MKKRKLHFSTLVVIFSVMYIIAFTAIMCYLMYLGMVINDSLIYCTFSFFTVELLSIAGIKVSKTKYSNTYEDNLEMEEE